jgi:hypothetical protein
MAWVHVRPSRLLTAALMLKIRDTNHNVLTVSDSPLLGAFQEKASILAVTLENSVATVDRLVRSVTECSWDVRIVGMPRLY